MNNINLYLIRHAQSTGNLNADRIGQSASEPLTDLGLEQAQRLGQRLLNSKIKFDMLLSSTFRRAGHTAEIVKTIIGHDKPIKYSDAIVEYNPGDWMGKNRSELYSDPTTLKRIVYQNMSFKFPHGESYKEVERRISTYIEETVLHNEYVLELAETSPVNIAVFSHGMTIKSFLHYILGFDASLMWKIRCDNTSISHVAWTEKGWYIYSMNDTGHLLEIVR